MWRVLYNNTGRPVNQYGGFFITTLVVRCEVFHFPHMWTMWYILDDVVYTGRCGIYLTMWYIVDDVVYTRRCGIYLTMWYILDDVVYTGRCGIYLTMWYILDDVVYT